MNTKNFSILRSVTLGLLFVGSLTFQSCNKKAETDPKEVAEDQNEAAIESDTTLTNKAEDAREDVSEFLVDAAATDRKEIEAGKLAQTKSTDAGVKAHGKMMEAEHTKALAAVTALAAAKGVALPTDTSEDAKEKLADLNKKSGKDFDKAYVDAMVDGHEKAIKKFEDGTKESMDPDVKAWGEKTLPVLRMHLDHTLELQKKFK